MTKQEIIKYLDELLDLACSSIRIGEETPAEHAYEDGIEDLMAELKKETKDD